MQNKKPTQSQGVSLYIQVKDRIQEAIHNGTYKEGDKLLSEMQFCEQYGVSRITVRQALKELETLGVIYSVHGKGYFVKKISINDDLSKISPFGDTLRRKGYSGFTKIVEFSDTSSIRDYDILLDDPEYGDPCEMLLLGYSEGIPMVLYHSVLRRSIGIKMHEQAELMEGEQLAFSTFDLYDRIGITVGNVMQRVSARNADAKIAEKLQIKEGAALLVLESMIYDEKGMLLEFKRGYYRGDKYSFNIRRDVR